LDEVQLRDRTREVRGHRTTHRVNLWIYMQLDPVILHVIAEAGGLLAEKLYFALPTPTLLFQERL